MKKTDFFRFGFVALYNRKERESKWVPIIDKEKKMVAVMIDLLLDVLLVTCNPHYGQCPQLGLIKFLT